MSDAPESMVSRARALVRELLSGEGVESLEDYRRLQMRRLSGFAVLALGIFLPVLSIVDGINGREDIVTRYVSPQGTVIMICVAAFRLSGRGQVTAAGWLFNVVLTGATLGAMSVTREAAQGLMFLGVGVLISALVFKPRAIAWVTAMNVAGVALVLSLVEITDIDDPVYTLVMHGGFFAIVGFLSYASARGNQNAFEKMVQAKGEAESASQAKSQFLANMSHELRTPLTAILGYTELIGEEAEDAEIDAFDSDLERIERSARHLLVLIDDVLDLAKVEARKFELVPTAFELGEFMEDLALTGEALAAKRSNELVCEVPEARVSLFSDRVRLRQVVLNLLSNAAKFTESGRIDLRASWDEELEVVRIEVEDTGIGMTEEQQLRVFEEFEQAERDTSLHFGGTGLGLALARRMVELLGGSLVVRSALGEGSCFSVTVPAHHERAEGS